MVEYTVYELPLSLTNSDISAIVSAYTSRACTIKETASDSNGNSWQVFLILQGYYKQYVVAPNVDDAKVIVKNALVRVATASGVSSLSEANIDSAVGAMVDVSVDDIEGPWRDVSAEWELLGACLEQVESLKEKLSVLDKAYLMLVKADSTPEAEVIVVPKAYSVIRDVAASIVESSELPASIAGFDAVVVTGSLSDDERKGLLKVDKARVVYNSVQCMEELFGSKPNVISVTANYVQYVPDLGSVQVSFIDMNGITVFAVDPDTLPGDVTVVAEAITPAGDNYPVIFGCNVNGEPIVWDLVGFGVDYPDNLPESYKDSNVINRGLKFHNYVINVVPVVGWGPLKVVDKRV